MKVISINDHIQTGPVELVHGTELEHMRSDPKDGDLYLNWLKSEETLMEGLERCWRANRLSDLSIGAKDSSNHLVAGSFRNIPQDS